MLKTSILTNLSTNAIQIGIDYNGVNYGATTSILKTSSLTDSSASAAYIEVNNNRVDNSDGCNGNFNKKFAF